MFTIGCDPELFLKKGDDFVCAWGLIPGDKKNPHPVEGGSVQVDGFAVEFNTPPVKNEEEFVMSVNKLIQELYKLCPGYSIEATPVAEFSMEYIKSQPEEARELGCDPDYNAWEDGQIFPKPNGEVPFRTGAGHFHIGWTENETPEDPDHFARCIQLTKQLDFFLGLPSVILDKDKKRREMYGKAGCFRPKPYGVEYRTLSNFWVDNEKVQRLLFKNIHKAIELLMEGEHLYLKEDIQDVINNSDEEKALWLCNKYGINYEV